MICFLTSRTDIPETGGMDPGNGFIEELRRRFPHPCRALHICSNPDNRERMDFYAAYLKNSFETEGFSFERFEVLDGRNEDRAEELVRSSNLLILAGGHVPTQNRFFQKIGLRALIKDFDGMVIGISAGSMNSADIVYSQPEEEGEAVDPAYKRFLRGLGLTKTMLLPHYEVTKDETLDGLHLFNDIACPDSIGRTFYAIPDGAYLLIENGREELRGEAYRIRDGVIGKVCEDGGILPL